jgi:hypothetical protein
MKTHLYLSLIPESLILSHLAPNQFGAYMATGNKRTTEGPAIFLELDPGADLSAFPMEKAYERFRPHADGGPRRSTYVAVYNVLPRVPLGAILNAYLTTPAGLALKLDQGEWKPAVDERLFLYQEMAPVYPEVASCLDPKAFCELVTAADKLVSIPRLAFVDLRLGALAMDPDSKEVENFAHPRVDHLRECLRAVLNKGEHPTKIVNRSPSPDIVFPLIKSGLFIGDAQDFLHFPLPSEETLETQHTLWWHSAKSMRGY